MCESVSNSLTDIHLFAFLVKTRLWSNDEFKALIECVPRLFSCDHFEPKKAKKCLGLEIDQCLAKCKNYEATVDLGTNGDFKGQNKSIVLGVCSSVKATKVISPEDDSGRCLFKPFFILFEPINSKF